MKIKEELILKFRKLQTIISVLLFFMVLIFFVNVTDFHITEIQISKWGTLNAIGWVFNISLVVLSISTFANSFLYIKNNKRILDKKKLYLIFGFVSFTLFVTGVFDVKSFYTIHNISAFLYFFSYPLAIFLMAYINRANISYREWLFHLITSISMIIIPLFLMSQFNGMAISEIVHSSFVVFWHLSILNKRLN